MRTREGAVGVVMQNWHAGPMGFQFIADGITMLMALSAQRALEWLVQPSPVLPNLPPIPASISDVVTRECYGGCRHKECYLNGQANDTMFGYACKAGGRAHSNVCLTGNEPRFSEEAAMKETWRAQSVKDQDANVVMHSNPWEYVQIKFLSSIHSARERDQEQYSKRPECSAFIDKGYFFKSMATNMTDWLQIEWTAAASIRLGTGTKKMHMYVCHGQRNLKDYFVIPGPDWVLDVTVDGKPVNGRGLYLNEGRTMIRTCVQANVAPLPAPPKVGTKFAIRFRRVRNETNPTPDKPQSIGVGNFFFFGLD